MNREQAIRKGFYDTLKTGITNNSNEVHIYDSSTIGNVPNEKLYIIMTGQSALLQPEDCAFTWSCIQTLEIVHKQLGSATKEVVDNISEQIEQAIIYVANGNGMTEQAGWEFHSVFLEQANYADFELAPNSREVTKILDFRVIVTKIQ